MIRDLTERERDVLAFMVDKAQTFPGDPPALDEDRGRWRAQLGEARAGGSCGCGSCPSIEIETGPDTNVATATAHRIVLTTAHPDATLLLFVDDDRLSYLELAPHGDEAFVEFPLVDQLSA
ncbi:hypothetical protein [Cryobacterium arcticum]|uniref:Uncharacterized protein n=1 Tax=Cryobacterium arcticum TaxID=670052 RepID=A0A1B1BLL1_9MICO|nr:hypothetical protein [Cryobacterium arcticum]ANP73512.1 hypothetical protein PA27867_2568 [Cryobacterium arcticum]